MGYFVCVFSPTAIEANKETEKKKTERGKKSLKYASDWNGTLFKLGGKLHCVILHKRKFHFKVRNSRTAYSDFQNS